MICKYLYKRLKSLKTYFNLNKLPNLNALKLLFTKKTPTFKHYHIFVQLWKPIGWIINKCIALSNSSSWSFSSSPSSLTNKPKIKNTYYGLIHNQTDPTENRQDKLNQRWAPIWKYYWYTHIVVLCRFFMVKSSVLYTNTSSKTLHSPNSYISWYQIEKKNNNKNTLNKLQIASTTTINFFL